MDMHVLCAFAVSIVRRAPSASIPAVVQACSRASRESFIGARTRRRLPTCDHR